MHKKALNALVFTLVAIFALATSPRPAAAQGPELSLAYAHSTGNFGVDGFNLGAAYWFTPRVTVAVDYDSLYDTSRIDAFGFTSAGLIASHSHLQTLMAGPRIFFSDQRIKDRSITPFAEVQVGYTRLHSDLQQATFPNLHISDNAFAWLVGGGADYRFDDHWSARVKLGLLRTHLEDTGQTRLKFAVGVTYTFGEHLFNPVNQKKP